MVPELQETHRPLSRSCPRQRVVLHARKLPHSPSFPHAPERSADTLVRILNPPDAQRPTPPAPLS
ncbi:hypothetical protein GCM10023213_47520 [Prosthecobacter algae]|uniref:Uncharacterized protein n=1 Tax=Prosthecobacter algae TaxID=1144682 RepID=A0ABP9PNU5_9BACT